MAASKKAGKGKASKKKAAPITNEFDQADLSYGLEEPELIWKILGGTHFTEKQPSTSFDFYEAVKKGMPKLSVDSLARILGLPMTKMAKLLNLSYKTLTRKKTSDVLALPISSHTYEMAQTVAKGLLVFGEVDRFNRWVNKPVMALHGEKPIDLFDSPIGLTLVNQILMRVEEGIYS